LAGTERPVRLVAQDAGLSRRKQGFETPTGRQINQKLSTTAAVLPNSCPISAPQASPMAKGWCEAFVRTTLIARNPFFGVADSIESRASALTRRRPETILPWHRAGFKMFWRWKSRHRAGRPRIDRGLRDLIRRMSREKPLWGASRIHGELLMLGFEVVQSTVSKYMVGRRNPPSQPG
jgi:hypothetical protein